MTTRHFLTMLDLTPEELAGVIQRAIELKAMQREGIDDLPLYPEERKTQRPTAEQILRLFSLTQRHHLQQEGVTIRTFHPELTALQRQLLALLKVPLSTYCPVI